MNKIDIAKKIASSVASISVGYTVTSVVIQNVARPETKLKQLELVIGTFVIASMVSDVAEQYTNKQIDKIVAAVSKTKEDPTEA